MKPLLSICIPTYNRCEYLKNSINSIVEQPEFKSGDVEVVISDNASTDGTEVLCRKYENQYKNFKYFCNSENVVDRNFPLSLSRGKGVLRKLGNDTLIYYPGSLKRICELVRKYSDTRPQIFFLDKFRDNVKDDFIECESFDFFTETVGTSITWIGTFSLWENDSRNIENDTNGCELNLWQCRKAYDLVAEKKHAIICNLKITKTQGVKSKDRSYGVFNVFYNNHLMILGKYLKEGLLADKTYEYIRREILYSELMSLDIQWEVGKPEVKFSENENPLEMTENAYRNEEYWPDYLRYYKKKKRIFVIKQKIKSILKKLHVWNIIIDFLNR